MIREVQAGVLGVTEGFLEQRDEVGVGEPVVDVGAVPAGLDEPGVAQGAEVTADGALGELEGIHEGGDAQFAGDEAQQDLDADGFGEGFEEGGDVPKVVRVGGDVDGVVLHTHTLLLGYPDRQIHVLTITTTVSAASLLDHVKQSDDPRASSGTELGFRLADPARIAHARLLTVTPISQGWTVTGGSQARTVIRQGAAFSCNCPDNVQLCKHLLAVGLHLA